MLVKDEFVGCGKLVGELKDDDIITILASKISPKVDETVDNYQKFLLAKAQG